MEKSLALIDDLIHLEEERDKAFKIAAIKAHKASQATGESAILYHLKQLKELVKQESQIVQFNFVSVPHDYDGQIGSYTLENWPRNGGYLFPAWWVRAKVNFKREDENIGKRVKVIGPLGDSWVGREGVIEDHYLDGDDCSGSFGKEKYAVKDDHGQRWSLTTDRFAFV